MNHPEKIKKKIKFSRDFIISIIGIVFVIVIWGVLTKMDHLPNYLGIKWLCSGKHLSGSGEMLWGKPVIYLYPEEKTDVRVRLDYTGEIIADYPSYNNLIKGWEVTAFPDGRLINKADNKEYSYLFWEGIQNSKVNFDLSEGFIVKGNNIREFLQEILSEIGLTPEEYNEFIVYWYPQMKDNKYNLIHFAEKEYTDTAPLTITPTPDFLLRVFMVYKAINEPFNIKPQSFKRFSRDGFTVVEWGGTKIN